MDCQALDDPLPPASPMSLFLFLLLLLAVPQTTKACSCFSTFWSVVSSACNAFPPGLCRASSFSPFSSQLKVYLKRCFLWLPSLQLLLCFHSHLSLFDNISIMLLCLLLSTLLPWQNVNLMRSATMFVPSVMIVPTSSMGFSTWYNLRKCLLNAQVI